MGSEMCIRDSPSHKLLCPFARNPFAPLTHPPFSVRPSRPNSRLPAPTVSLTRSSPPPAPLENCARSLSERESRQAVLPLRRLSARWWPVALELKGSKMDLVGLAAGGAVGGMF